MLLWQCRRLRSDVCEDRGPTRLALGHGRPDRRLVSADVGDDPRCEHEPASSLMIGLTLYGLVTRKSALMSIAFYVGAALKFATIPLLLIPLFLGRYRMVAICAIVSVILTIVCVALTGIGPWREYVALVPTFTRPNPYPVSVSAISLINRFVSSDYLSIAVAVRQAALVIFLGVRLCGLYRNRHQEGGSRACGRVGTSGVVARFRTNNAESLLLISSSALGLLRCQCQQSWLARLYRAGDYRRNDHTQLAPLAVTYPLLRRPTWFGPRAACLFYGIARLYQQARAPTRRCFRWSGKDQCSDCSSLTDAPPGPVELSLGQWGVGPVRWGVIGRRSTATTGLAGGLYRSGWRDVAISCGITARPSCCSAWTSTTRSGSNSASRRTVSSAPAPRNSH